MKYIIFAYNYPTLCKAIRYVDSVFGKNDAVLIYSSFVNEAPKELVKEYGIIEIGGKQRDQQKGIRRLVVDVLTTREICKAFKSVIKKWKGEHFTLVVFKDNEAQDATLIDLAYSFGGEIWEIEEGAGIYTIEKRKVSHKNIKRIVYPIFRVSSYAITDNPQGLHPHVSKIISAKPDLLKEKYAKTSKKLEKQIEVFTDDFSRRFVLTIMPEKKPDAYEYVFLTTPMGDLLKGDIEKQLYTVFLEHLFSMLEKYGRVLIKPHPRDQFDYQLYETNRVKVCEKNEQMIPFECLLGFYKGADIISLVSSANTSITRGGKSIFVYPLLGIERIGADIRQSFLEEHNIIKCNSYEELEAILEAKKQNC